MSHHRGQVSRCDWRTPKWFLERVRRVFCGPIGLDPATAPDNPTQAIRYCTEREDGLEQDWGKILERTGTATIFCNPPWRRAGMPVVWWAAPIWSFALDHPWVNIITTMPASVNSTWWHDFVAPAPRNLLLRGRMKYDPPPGFAAAHGPTFDTCVTYWGPDPERFDSVMGDLGKLVR